jgi:hypothetical protein
MSTEPFSWRGRMRLVKARAVECLDYPFRPNVKVSEQTYAVISAYARAKGSTNKAFVESLLRDLPRPSWMRKPRAV